MDRNSSTHEPRKPAVFRNSCATLASFWEKTPRLQPIATVESNSVNILAPMEPAEAAAMPTSGSCAEEPFHETRYGWFVLAAVWLASAAYMWANLRNGWSPMDAGGLSEMAYRVLQGQVPNRDFADFYVGGLTYLNALSFRLLGANFFSLRIPLFLLFLGWVPSVYSIARRFVMPPAAAGVTLLSVAWSVPNYPEGMPTWYLLFFATWGVLALVRYTETRHHRWLWIAGFCAGLSLTFHVFGLYFIAAALLFLLFSEMSMSQGAASRAHGDLFYKAFVSAGLLIFLAMVADLILQRPTATEAFHFILPAACLVFLLLRMTWQAPAGGSWPRLRRLFSMLLPFVGGASIPVAIFAGYYLRIGALGNLLSGVFGSSAQVVWAAVGPLPLPLVVGLAPLIAILLLAYHRSPTVRRAAPPVAAGLLGVSLVLARTSLIAYIALGMSLPILAPAVALGAVILSLRGNLHGRRKEQQIFLLVAAAVLCALMQFPFSQPIYFCYVAPLVILAITALLSTLPAPNRPALTALVLFYLAFAVWLRTPGFFNTLGFSADKPYSFTRLNLAPAGGIHIGGSQALEYERLIHALRAHAHGPYTYCTPDCPEVYFLSGLLNPTPTSSEFRDPDFLDPVDREYRILETLEHHGVNEVVLAPPKWAASGPLPSGLREALDAKFPHSERVGKFEVRWK